MPTRQRARLLFQGSSSFLKRNSVAAWKASSYDGSSYLKDLFGRSAFDARLGSTSGSDSNDPLFLDYAGLKYLYLPGAVGNYGSTPDAAALDITGDIDIRCAVAMDDWTPAAVQHFVAKWTETGNQRSYRTGVNTDGTLFLRTSTLGDAATVTIFTSTAAPTVTDGALLLVRFTLDVNIGGTNKEAVFYTKASTVANAYTDALADTGWTQLGAAVNTAVATSIFAGTAVLEVGTINVGTANSAAGKFYAAVVKSGIAGTTVFAANFTDSSIVEPYATFTESSAQAATVTINRAASGRKSAMVDRKLFLFGTDDLMEVPDHASLDLGATDSFTAIAVIRTYGNPPAAIQALISKKVATGTDAGWYLVRLTSDRFEFKIADGTVAPLVASPAGNPLVAGVLTAASGVRNVGADLLYAYHETNSLNNPDTTTTTLANSEVLRIGRYSGAGTNCFDGEFVAAAIFRKALSAAEIAQAIIELKAA